MYSPKSWPSFLCFQTELTRLMNPLVAAAPLSTGAVWLAEDYHSSVICIIFLLHPPAHWLFSPPLLTLKMSWKGDHFPVQGVYC